MLKILKAELAYTRYWIIRFLGILPPLLIYFYLLNRWWLNGIVIFGGLFLSAIAIKIRFKEERLRFETLLPVSLRKIAFSRIILSIFPVIVVYGFCEIIDLVPQLALEGWRDSGAERFMFLGLILFLLFTYHILSDLITVVVYNSKARLMEIYKSIIVGIIFVFGAGTVSSIYLKSEDAGLSIIKIIFLLDFILAWISIRSFSNRRSFYNN